MSTHPDLEQLSASLDGEDATADAHVRGCRTCQGRLADLRAVRDALAGPVAPLAAADREQMLARALAAADGWTADGEQPEAASDAPPDAAPSPWTPAPAPRRPEVTTPARRRASQRWWVAGSAAAAAVLVLTVAFAALLTQGSGRDDETALSAGDRGAQEQATAGAGAGQVVDGGDLGDIADVPALRERIPPTALPVYGQTATSFPVPAAGARPSAGVGGESLAGPADAARSSSTSPAGSEAVAPPRAIGTRVCEVEARTARPQLGTLVYAATARYAGSPAVILGFAAVPGQPPVTLLVLAQEGCRLLAESTTP